MCGRYYIEIDYKELKDILEAVKRRAREYPAETQMSLKMDGEIFPSNVVPVQTGVDSYEAMKWGFTAYDGKLLINARSETALEKPTFRASMLERRCLIPASGYYEWQTSGNSKTKYRFFLPGQPLYLAGCYRQEKDSPLPSFVILTRRPPANIASIHDRMPVIIPPLFTAQWLKDDMAVMEYALQDLSYEPA